MLIYVYLHSIRYQHQHHKHDHHHHHGEESFSEESTMDYLSKILGGTKVSHIGKRRRIQQVDYTFQVDLFIEIDQAFINKSGGTMNAAVNYVNALVTAANSAYEKEIGKYLVVNLALCVKYLPFIVLSPSLTTLTSSYRHRRYSFAR